MSSLNYPPNPLPLEMETQLPKIENHFYLYLIWNAIRFVRDGIRKPNFNFKVIL